MSAIDRNVAQLVLEVSASTAVAQRQLEDLARAVNGSTNKMNLSLGTMDRACQNISKSFNAVKASAIGFFGAMTAGTIVAEIKKSLDYAGSLGEVARTLGVTTTQLQTFRYAAGQTGVAQDQLEVGLRRLTVSMGKAELGSSAQAKAFKAIGISVDQLRGKNTGDVFLMLADALSKVTDRSQRAAIEMTLMGRSGSTLDNLLAPGVARLNELANAAQDLGIVLSTSQIQSAEETAHKLESLKNVLSSNIAGVVAENAKSIYDLANAVAHLVAMLPNAVQQIKSFYASFLNFSATVTEGFDQAIESPLARFAPGFSAFRGGAMHENRVRNAQADRAEAAGIQQSIQDQKIRALFARQELRFGPGPLGRAAPPGIDLPEFLAGKGPKAKKAPKDHSAEQNDEFEREMAQLNREILAARMQLAGGYEAQAALAEEEVRSDEKEKLATIQKEVDGKRRSAVQAAQLKAQVEELTATKLAVIARQKITDQLAQQRQAVDQAFGFQLDDLKFADEMATTQKARRAIQLQLLDIQYQQKEADLRNLLATQQLHGDLAAAAITQADIARLPIDKAHDQRRVDQGTLSPLEQWAKSVPQTAAEINEALQSIEAQGLDGLASAITDVITGTKSLKAAFKDVASSIIGDILQMTIRMLIFRAMTSIFGNIGGGGLSLSPDIASPGALSSLSGGVSPSALLSAKGNIFSGGNVLPFARGGIVNGPTIFPMANGGIGLMGEAGPEAVMPLARDGSGRLGVRASRMAPPRGANGGQIELVIHSAPSDDAWAKVQSVSTGAAVKVLHAGSPAIIKASIGGMARLARRPKLMGG